MGRVVAAPQLSGLRLWMVRTLVAMGVIAWTLEPAFYTSHPAWWSGAAGRAPTAFEAATLRVWRVYTQYDPVFEAPPEWLVAMCWIEVLLFGPLYFAAAWAVARRPPWARAVLLPFAGALLYSTLLYYALELRAPVPGTSAAAVLLVNAPWTLVPLLLPALL
jgi:hypothetical protein